MPILAFIVAKQQLLQ